MRALSLSLAAHQVTVLAQEFSSLNGFLDRILGVTRSFDHQALFADLNRELDALNRAGAQIWISQDQETVTLTNSVVMASLEVLGAVASLPKVGLFGMLVRIWRGVRFGHDDAIQIAQKRLADARKALVEHTRESLKLEAVELFALPTGSDVNEKPSELSDERPTSGGVTN